MPPVALTFRNFGEPEPGFRWSYGPTAYADFVLKQPSWVTVIWRGYGAGPNQRVTWQLDNISMRQFVTGDNRAVDGMHGVLLRAGPHRISINVNKYGPKITGLTTDTRPLAVQVSQLAVDAVERIPPTPAQHVLSAFVALLFLLLLARLLGFSAHRHRDG